MGRTRLFPFGTEPDAYQDLRTLIGASQSTVEIRALDWLHYFLLQVGMGAHITSASDQELWNYEPSDFTHLRLRTSVNPMLRTYIEVHKQETQCERHMSCLQGLTGYPTDRLVMQCAYTHFRWVVTEARRHHRIIIVSHDYEESYAVIDPHLPFPTMRPTIFVDN